MKKILFVVALLFCLLSNAQNQTNSYSSKQIEVFIKEVFGDSADELVFKSETDRLQLITDFFSRVEVKYVPELRGKGFKSLDDVKLSNKYNSGLKRDVNVNLSTFNPLKYDVSMLPKEREIYRIGNTDYILIIKPVENTIN
ncbi:hypothetical protein [Flavobacterium sp.]|uniref:hypothetical protein n=1 Tax=Flavobacterium sp. TaxID=239 RepID=UPI0028BF2AEC|nr:hypothetical protein [Flavobacterium sp.]